ncbi:uncharacterized protein isoform X1 [Leptinotarsa decemlineata]|uniref:uncharacterized protein isoform X1 n=1 Tax=Leptinotarsa decemlineata TaxID=7539 RepID=UPI003D3070CA
MRNVEIKAKVCNLDKLVELVKALGPQRHEIIKQKDTFYKVPNGRLKLRKFENGSGELIYYERPDTEGPKMCLYEKSTILAENLNSIHTTLEKALGTKIVVNKIRQLFMIGQTRVHVDSVEDLGDFMELEVVLKDEQTSEEGEKIAFDIMEKLEISKENLISGAYADLLRDK